MKIKSIMRGMALALPFLWSSCNDTPHEENVSEKLCAYFSIDELKDAADSRITISPNDDGTYNFVWNADEVIGIFPFDGYQEPFEIPSTQAGQGKVSFDGGDWALKSGCTYAAYYPFDKKNFESKEMKTRIAVSYVGQKQVGDTYGVSSYDYLYTPWVEAPASGSLDFKFKHLGSLGIFNVTFPAAGTYTELSIQTGSYLITVNGTYDLTDNDVAYIGADEKTNKLTLALEQCSVNANDVRKFHLWVPPMDLSAQTLKLVLKDSNGKLYESSIASTNFEAGKKYVFNVTNLVEKDIDDDVEEEVPYDAVVATAIPAFIGITEKAVNGSESLVNKPWKINSMAEFIQFFGGASLPVFNLSVAEPTETDAEEMLYCSEPKDGVSLKVAVPTNLYTLYYNMVMFFANGGGTCYIVSVGKYDEGKQVDKDKVEVALDALEKVREVTMIAVPEAVNAKDNGCKDIQQLVIKHCGEMQNRFAIFDVQPKANADETMSYQIEKFRDNIGDNYLSYGAAYYPYLNTSVLADKDIDGTILYWETAPDLTAFFGENSKIGNYVNECFADMTDAARNNVHSALLMNWEEYKKAASKVKDYLNLLPPSAAMAGIYTMVDNTRGVWVSPANVSINLVNSITEDINNNEIEYLMPTDGKAINAICTFPGEGVKVWGARTLDGNSQDWHFVNKRRTMIYIEESVKNIAKTYVFEPNVETTWLNMKSMIGSFLSSVWEQGGLVDAVPEEAFAVEVGLGETMTSDDILKGIMRITVKVAITFPAEFIEITFEQQVQN